MAPDHSAVLITGACGNLGRAAAATFAARGRNLALLDRDDGQLVAAFGADGTHHLNLACNLLDAAAVAHAVEQAAAKFGPIGVLCNIAGGFRMGEPVHETSDATWDFLMNLNVRSVLHTARAVVPGMVAAGGGAIVNIGAGAAARGGANMGAYAASKSALARITESMSAELREKGINVNAVLPSIIDTPENRKDMPDADPKKWVAPEELAEVIAFLCSPAARAIHGASLPVSGLS
ncbi:MAG TPA: SDR family NAD(P)-dependent oxidoreductase [Ramlibacter sp.]|nr:SDR family NAD(P)-dependent oxidoreductase [Ramlibacter sp.]